MRIDDWPPATCSWKQNSQSQAQTANRQPAPTIPDRTKTQHLAVMSDALQLAVYIPETVPGGIHKVRVFPRHVILHCVCLDGQIPVPSPRKG